MRRISACCNARSSAPEADVSSLIADPVASFPLESPKLQNRRRESSPPRPCLPYFIAGEENRMVSYLCQADFPVFRLGNPILLLGPHGVGKTSIALHLAAQHGVAEPEVDGPASTLYLPAVDFARQFAEAVETDDIRQFRSQMDEAPILIIDDLQLISHKPAAQDELASRLDARVAAGRATLITSRRLPSEVRGIRPMLASRVLPGLTVPVRVPAEDARRILLREFALQQDVEVSPRVLDSLSARLEQEVSTRSLEAAVKQIALWCRANQRPAAAEAIQSALEVLGRDEEVSMAEITRAVSRIFRQKTSDLRSGSRKQQIVRSRSLAMYLARRLTTKSMHQIGDYFGGRDHTTVLHAVRKTETLIEQDADLRRAADEVTEKLSSS